MICMQDANYKLMELVFSDMDYSTTILPISNLSKMIYDRFQEKIAGQTAVTCPF